MGTPRDEEIRTLAKQLFIHRRGDGFTDEGRISEAERFVDMLDKRYQERMAERNAKQAELRATPGYTAGAVNTEHVPEPARAVYDGAPVCERHPIFHEKDCAACNAVIAHQFEKANTEKLGRPANSQMVDKP